MKYKVGDKVRVRGDLEINESYGSKTFTCTMSEFLEEIFTIAEEKYDSYLLKELISEEYCYWFTDEMLRPAEFKIWCETEEEKRAVLEELEKEGYVWNDSNKKPTEHINDIISYTYPIGFYLIEDRLSYSAYKGGFNNQSLEEFTPSEFTGIDFSEKIIITKTTTGATATYGDKTVTTEGEFEDASRQALAEVLCPFKVGDEVKSKILKIHGKVEKVQIDGKITIGFSNDSSMNCFGYELEPYTEPLYNAKLFCIKGSDRFREGYIYKIIDGKFDREGAKYSSLEAINHIFSAKFMEVIEE